MAGDSKTMNAQLHQKPCVSRARGDPPPLSSPLPQSMSADYKIAAGPFLFCLDKAPVVCAYI